MARTLARLSKYLLFLGLIANIAISLALLLTKDDQRTTAGPFYRFVIGNRTATQILVQIVAQILGALLTFAVTTLFNYFTRMRLSKASTSIETIKLWQSICFTSPDPSLSFPRLLVSVCFLCLIFVPPAMWAGALTPFVVSKLVDTSITIPVYSADPDNLFWNRSASPDITYRTFMSSDGKGMYSYNPSAGLSGSIVNAGAFATTKAGLNRTHAKLDNSRYSYRGRSYGVGASVGLLDLEEQTERSLRNFTFFETGYIAEVSCIHNVSSKWMIYPYEGDCSAYAEYIVAGAMPNSNPGTGEGIYFPGLCGDTSRILAMGGRMVNNRTVIAMATNPDSGPYSVLDKTQCEFFFKPTGFRIAVDVQSLLISVSALEILAQDIDPTSQDRGIGLGIVPDVVTQLVAAMSQTVNMYSSPLGDAFLANINSTAATLNTSSTEPTTILRAVEDSLKSIIDDTFFAYSSAQLMIAGAVSPDTSRRTVPVVAWLHAIRVGDRHDCIGPRHLLVGAGRAAAYATMARLALIRL